MPTPVTTALGALCFLLLLQAGASSAANVAQPSHQLSEDIDVTFDKTGVFSEEYGYDTEDGFYYSQYFTFSFSEATELRVSLNFNGHIPAGKALTLNLGGAIIPTVYPDEFKWVFSEPRATIIVRTPNWPEGHPDGASLPLPAAPSRIDLSIKISDAVAGKYKACRNGDAPLCETYGGEDRGLLYVGVGYSLTPVPEPATHLLGLVGGVMMAMAVAARRLH